MEITDFQANINNQAIMPTLWRLQTNTDSDIGMKIAEYCINNNVLAIGWSLKNNQIFEHLEKEQIAKQRDKIKTFKVYGTEQVNENINRFSREVKEGHLVWIRLNGIYYLGRVTSESKWRYNLEALNYDAAIQITNVEWLRVGDESDVPGVIATSLIRGKTLQRINNENILNFSMLLYNKLGKEKDYYKNVNISFTQEDFYNFLSPSDCEDLLCMWLFYTKGYICIPSTNKKSTELYECVLVDPKIGKRVYTQVKKGKINLKTKDFEHLNGEVWLLTTKGKVIRNSSNEDNIYVANPKELFDFIKIDISKKILPKSILMCYEMLSN